jgi:hypothetical protein
VKTGKRNIGSLSHHFEGAHTLPNSCGALAELLTHHQTGTNLRAVRHER